MIQCYHIVLIVQWSSVNALFWFNGIHNIFWHAPPWPRPWLFPRSPGQSQTCSQAINSKYLVQCSTEPDIIPMHNLTKSFIQYWRKKNIFVVNNLYFVFNYHPYLPYKKNLLLCLRKTFYVWFFACFLSYPAHLYIPTQFPNNYNVYVYNVS